MSSPSGLLSYHKRTIQMDKFVKITKREPEKKIIADRDGAIIEYYCKFIDTHEANELFNELKNLADWKIGKIMTPEGLKSTSRLVLGLTHPDMVSSITMSTRGYGSLRDRYGPEPNSQTNLNEESGSNDDTSENDEKVGKYNVFTPLLMRAHEKIKELSGETFNFAFLNYYRNGNDHVGWHCDREETLEAGSTIASLSLGQTRDFMLRHIGDTRLAQSLGDDQLRLEALEAARMTVSLSSGSLLLMKKLTQKVYHHHVPKRVNANGVRINITFRHIRDLTDEI